MKIKVVIVAGARPNFMKISPIIREICENRKNKIEYRLVHTGQHYDSNMSKSFFNQLKIPNPDINLNCGGGSHAEQTAEILVKFDSYILEYMPDLIIVVGDVNSTMACSIVAKKRNIKLAHVEAGLRSYDNKMPEEINRIITDSISDYFFTTSKLASQNLIENGISENNIFFVGNTMIDTLKSNLKYLYPPKLWDDYKLEIKKYIVITLHRPSNVDNLENLKNIVSELILHSKDVKLIFSVHPRTKKNLDKLSFNKSKLILTDPISYLEFNYLVKNSLGIFTDSGGITEETTFLNVPCITFRNSTERPETVNSGTNELIGADYKQIQNSLEKLISGNWKKGEIPEKWDGLTSKRIVNTICKLFSEKL